MSPLDKSDASGSPAPQRSGGAVKSVPARKSAEADSDFKAFDRSGMPEAKRLSHPDMKGRIKRSQENRARRKRRRRMRRLVLIPSAIGIVFLILIGMTVFNFKARERNGNGSAAKGEGVAEPAAVSPVPEKARSVPPVARRETKPGGEIQSARDRFLLRTAPVDVEGEISEESKSALRAAGLPAEGEGDGEGEEISDEEKMRLLRKAAPYSRTVREGQQKREVSPDDLYIPKAK